MSVAVEASLERALGRTNWRVLPVSLGGEGILRTTGRARERVFLASKTHERSRDRALRLLDDSLRRLGTDRLDLWQMHDLRELDEVDVLAGKGGALEAAAAAKG